MGTLHYLTAVTRRTPSDACDHKIYILGLGKQERTSRANKMEAPVLGKARLRVEGMTCGTCVHLIQAKVKEMKGVVDILVSLENSVAMVTFDRGVVDSAKVARAVEEVENKFKASLVAEIVDIFVEGMTCQSCVKVITTKLQEVEGVKQAEVSLEEKQAHVEFDPGQTTAESLVKVINGMGTKFTATLTQHA